MKKGIFSSLVLASCLFATSVAGADEFNSANFEQKYPNTHHFLNSLTSNLLFQQIFFNNAVGDAINQPNSNKKDSFSIQAKEILTKQSDCYSRFNNQEILAISEADILKKVSKTDLNTIENYYASPLGQIEIANGEKFVTLLKQAKLTEFEEFNNSPQVKGQSKAIDDFHKKNEKLLNNFLKQGFSNKKSASIMKRYIESCSIE